MDSGTQQSIRAGQATPRLQKLSGDILNNSCALVASGRKAREDKSLPGFMKLNKFEVSEMKDVLAVRCQPLEFQPCMRNSAAVCLASCFPALGPEFLF